MPFHSEEHAEDWRRLFEAAAAYKKLACWNWMSDEDYFAVTDPETGELGYCVVMGAGGSVFGLNVYTGPHAAALLKTIRENMSRMADEDNKELMLMMETVTVSFEDRSALSKEDLGLIRSLGLKFRGSGDWPQFRSYNGGYIPWGLHARQVRFLTVALEQTQLVARRFRENTSLYEEHNEQGSGIGRKRLHRYPVKAGDEWIWEDRWLPWYPEKPLYESYLYHDELRLQHMKKNLKKSSQVWETDYDFADIMVGERGERAHYPRLLLWVNRSDGSILDARLSNLADCREMYVEQFFDLLKKAGHKPAAIETGSPKAFHSLQDTAGKLGIKIGYDPYMAALHDARDAINEEL